MMRPGMKNGDTRRGPFSRNVHGRVGDALDAADAGADQHAGSGLILIACRPPAGVVERLARRAHGVDDEVVDLALLLRLHPLIGIDRCRSSRRRAGSLQAIWQAMSETSKRSILLAPLSPLSRRCHVVSTPHPSGVSIPIPVTTTRLMTGSEPNNTRCRTAHSSSANDE